MIELTDLQEDILTLAVENPDMTNQEIANVLDCSENWAGEVRRKYEHAVDENEVSNELLTVSGTATNPPRPIGEGVGDYHLGIGAGTVGWWLPVFALLQGNPVPNGGWLFMAAGWIAVPFFLFKDCKARGKLGSGTFYTVAGAILPMIVGAVYLYRRA